MVDAGNGRMTTSLFIVEDLLHTSDTGVFNYTLRALYSGDVIQYYHPLLETILTIDYELVFILFRYLDTFEAYQVGLYLLKVTHSDMTLDLASSLVLVAKDFSQYFIGNLESLHCIIFHIYTNISVRLQPLIFLYTAG